MARTHLPSNTSRLVITLAIILCISSVIFFFCWEPILDHIFEKRLVLTEDSQTFKLWRDTPIPMFMNFYFFNWTNPEELNIAKPRLAELGPYRFKMKEDKTNITWNENGTITYQIARKWYFDQSKSRGSLNDVVTTLNAVAMSAAHTVRDWSIVVKKPLSLSLTTTGQKIYIKQTVGDLLFDGYTDPLLEIAKSLPSFAGVYIPYDKFGWFYMRNMSSEFEGVFNMDTGERGIADFGKLLRWNYDIDTGYFEGSCGHVHGSAGELFPPRQSKNTPIQMFSADLCRTIRLDFSREEEVNGISGYKYVGGAWNLDNGTIDSANKCFCNGECPPVGALNLTSCRFGAPGFVSYPHFLYADNFYINSVDGMVPLPHKHSLFITLEPKTGIPLEVSARFQINILLSPVKGISLYQDVPKIYFPMMWFEQRASIDTKLSENLKFLLHLPTIGRQTCVASMFIGILVFIITICLSYRPKGREKILYLTNTKIVVENSGYPLIEK